MHLAFDAPAAGARRPQRDLHGAAGHLLLRGQGRGRPDHPAQCGPVPSDHGHGAAWLDAQLPAPGGGQWPHRGLPARRRYRAGRLAQALPERVTAAGNGCCTGAIFTGTRDDGSLWVYLETIGGGGGARPKADGLSGVHVHMTNTSNLPVEALELEYPLTLLRYELVNGSGRWWRTSRWHGPASRLSRRGRVQAQPACRPLQVAALGAGRRSRREWLLRQFRRRPDQSGGQHPAGAWPGRRDRHPGWRRLWRSRPSAPRRMSLATSPSSASPPSLRSAPMGAPLHRSASRRPSRPPPSRANPSADNVKDIQ
jgi:hypothetical protein